MSTEFWTAKEAADAWGISPERVYQIAHRVPGSKREIERSMLVWRIPKGAPKPAQISHGRPRKAK